MKNKIKLSKDWLQRFKTHAPEWLQHLRNLSWNQTLGFSLFFLMMLGYPVGFISLPLGSVMMTAGLIGGFIMFLIQGLDGWRKP